ncbi:MAG TPA: ATP-binding protein [Anaeromyxobacteraceae bacterium]|nr:ATP-binding protein [Anaeromyxobacteraceae bacterium]
MSLRSKLALAFALFAAAPLAAALWPVSRALSQALEGEHAARLAASTRAVEGELARIGEAAGAALRDLSRGPEAEALARERARGSLDPPAAASLARDWAASRGLDVLAVADAEGRVLSSAHLPGRAGDVDPELLALFGTARPGEVVPRLVAVAGPDGVGPALALLAWEEVRGGGSLRLVGGIAVGEPLAARLASLIGGAVSVDAADGTRLAFGAAEDPAAPIWRALWLRSRRVLGGGIVTSTEELLLPPGDAPVARIGVTLAPAGVVRAEVTFLAAFLAALVGGTAAATLVGAGLARRVTRPVEALRDGAARVARGDLEARVSVSAGGEVRELVDAFNAMTAELAASRTRLAAAERIAAWREVARRLAHEVKNPLTPIAMAVETLRDAIARDRPDFREIFEEGAQAIGEEVRRLKRIVDEFSRFARLPAPEISPVPAEELVSAVLALYPAPPKGVELSRQIEAGLPAVRADRDQILQVLLNLVTNAVEAMPGGGTLRVAARREAGAVAFSVSDSGPGIAPQDQPRVFEPYFTTKEEGTGLGLAIARRIAEEHGGSLDLESAPGRGATFTLRLPAAS